MTHDEVNEAFRECMFSTPNGTLVIDRDDFNRIVKQINYDWKKYCEHIKEENSFKRIFVEE